MPESTRPAAQSSLGELLRPVRRRIWLLPLLIVLAVIGSIAFSLTQHKRYTASAAYQFQAPNDSLSLVAIGTVSSLTPAQLASQAAQGTTQPAVVQRVRTMLGSRFSSTTLTGAVSASVDANSANVIVTATAPTSTDAASIANGFARASVAVANEMQRATYAGYARAVAAQAVPNHDAAAKAEQAQEVARLRELAAIGNPAQVTTVATPPGAPTSPRPARNAAIAAVLGLMVALLIAYGWDSLDRRLRSSDEIEAALGFPVVGRVRRHVLGASPVSTPGAAAIDQVDWEQFRILRRNVAFMIGEETSSVVAVTSAMPQEGKTTVAEFFAAASAAAGQRTILVECDLRRPVIAARLGLNTSPGVTDFVNGQSTPAEVVQTVSFSDRGGPSKAEAAGNGGEPVGDELRPGTHQFACITAGSSTAAPVEVLESAPFKAMLKQLTGVYDVVVLDTPPMLPVVDSLELMNMTNAVIVCARESTLTRDQADAGRRAVERAPSQTICLVVTGITKGSEGVGYYDYYSSYSAATA